MKFTDRGIRSLKPKAERYIVWEDNGKGLGVRVSPKGKKTLIFMYRFDGRNRMMTIGEFESKDFPKLADANLKHAQARNLLKNGIDPAAESVDEKKADREAYTITELKEEYIEKWAQPRKRSWEEDKRILEKDVLSEWKHRKAKSIKRGDVIALLDSIVDRGAGIMANRTLAVIRKMFNFAVSRDIIPYSPCAGVAAPSQENKRERVLDNAEIQRLWHNLNGADMHNGSKIALKLILVTAQRPGEVVSAKWEDIDLKGGWWIIQSEIAKNKHLHRVPLSALAIELFEHAQKMSSDGIYVFPSPRGRGRKRDRNKAKALLADNPSVTTLPVGKEKHIAEIALSYAMRRNLAEKLKLYDVTPHDLRRTASTNITALGITKDILKKVINHVENDVTAIYDRYSYDKEKRDALDKWATRLTEIINAPEPEITPPYAEQKMAASGK